jgi:hypothetical protein
MPSVGGVQAMPLFLSYTLPFALRLKKITKNPQSG